MTEKTVNESQLLVETLVGQRSDILTRIGATSRDLETTDGEISALEPVRQIALIDGDTSALSKIKKQLAALHERRGELRDLKSALENRATKIDGELAVAKADLKTARIDHAKDMMLKSVERYHAALPELIEVMRSILYWRRRASSTYTTYRQLEAILPPVLWKYTGEVPHKSSDELWNIVHEITETNRQPL